MSLFKNAINMIRNHRVNYLGYLFALMLPIFSQAGLHVGGRSNLVNSFASVITGVVGIFIVAGVYALFLEARGENKFYFSRLYDRCKQFFFRVLFISIISSIASGVLFLFPALIANQLIFSDLAIETFQTSIFAATTGSLSNALVSIVFLYALPCIYVLDHMDMGAISFSFKFLKLNLLRSSPMFLIIGITYIGALALTMLAFQFDYGEISYWSITAMNQLLKSSLLLVVFLMATETLEKSIMENGI